MPLSQQYRTLAVTTPLGEDVLLLRAMRGSERLSTLFEYQLDLISESRQPIKHEDLLGQPATVRLGLPGYQTRYFNGIVSRFSHTGFDGAVAVYQATLVPWFWLLTRTTDCRIFQNQTVPDIVKDIFREHGYTDFEEFLVEPHQSWNYCVQYRKTDFAFISRLLEQEGIHYFFRHADGKHTLVLADDNGAHLPVAGYETIPYYPPDETALRERDHIDDWSVAGAVQSGAFVQTDFDDTAPRKNLLTMVHHPHEHARRDLECYDYPGGYTQRDQGDGWVRARIEELHVDYETAQGQGNARGLATGARFKLTKYPRDDQNREYLLLSAEYKLQSNVFGSFETANTGSVFQCWFTALDAKTPYRPSRNTPRPGSRVLRPPSSSAKPAKRSGPTNTGGSRSSSTGTATANPTRTAPAGYTSPTHGPAKAEAPSPSPASASKSSSTSWKATPTGPSSPAGSTTASTYSLRPPRWRRRQRTPCPTASRAAAGTTNMSWTIPKAMNSSVSMVNSTKTAPSNMTCASMCCMIAAGMSPITRPSRSGMTVPRPSTTTRPRLIGVDRTETVENNEIIRIGINRTETVGANQTLTIGANQTENIGNNEVVSVALTRTHNVGSNDMLNVGGANEVTVGGAQAVTVGLAQAVSVGLNQATNIGKNLSIDVGDSITIKTGKASITMKKDDTITIQGKEITVKGSGGIDVKASKNVVIKGKKILEN